MQIIVALDKFKDSVNAADAARAVASGVKSALGHDDTVSIIPIADGGEGTLKALCDSNLTEVRVRDPIGRPVSARIGAMPDGTAVVEMAEASGLWRLAPHERDPTVTSTFGTGELIRAAVESGARRIVVGLGGSATVDAGLGALTALGLRPLDRSGKPVEPTGGTMSQVYSVDPTGLDARLTTDVSMVAACDVTSPLYGPLGAARQFAAQKGATGDQIELLEAGLKRVASAYADAFSSEVAEDSGSGAAGGLGAGLLGAFGAALVDGFEFVARAVGFDELLSEADLVITGEGAIDSTEHKVTAGVARHAARAGVPIAVVAGRIEVDPRELSAVAAVSVSDRAGGTERAMRDPIPYLVEAGREVTEVAIAASGRG